ncbi:MAG: wax ester/triacylglycerol synthase family O-acyltransferase [Gammaproteobacteria bacterium]|nr:wax ester/triacylglycerol synthase family O-acyltransferase [Gammaproteobacteria bacterium]NNF62207.1 wax ester/triacylglycerol synthase family O-acyltransferase [Gammaproteobacteria bacterium]NNM20580.1 wax ester/triacylglycerol synthase family O-acyltransferase [Gammaproteobacteria bacterium]
MASGDTAWLRMDSPTNLMMITGVIELKSRVTLQQVRDLIEQRFLSFPRFRMRAIQDLTGAWWEEDPEFDIANHVVAQEPPEDPSKRGLERLASQIASTPLNPDQPLWQYQVIENYHGGSAIIMRIHHCYADGMALVQVLLSMTDTEPQPQEKKGAPPRQAHHSRPLLDQIARQALALGKRGEKIGRDLLGELQDKGPPSIVATLARKGSDFAFDLARFVLKPPDARSRYRGALSPAKRVAWAEPLPLAEVKAVGKAHSCTVNDVLLSCVAGALRRWLVEQGDEVGGLEINATVPVNLRPPGKADGLGNHFGLVFLGIPIGIADPLERLHAVAANMADLKKSYQPQISLGMLSLVGRGPSVLQRPVLEMFSSKATTVMTNVPGPQRPLYFAGSEIDQLLFWVPQSGSIGMGVSILSYNGKVQFGLMTDSNLVPRPGQIIRRVTDEFEKLVLVTMMQPWQQAKRGEIHEPKAGS